MRLCDRKQSKENIGFSLINLQNQLSQREKKTIDQTQRHKEFFLNLKLLRRKDFIKIKLIEKKIENL